MKNILIFTLNLLVFINTFSQTNGRYTIGQKVEAYNVQWYKATVIGFGTGDLAGYIKVHYDDYSTASDQYLRESSIRIPKIITPASDSRNNAVQSAKYGVGQKVEAYNVQWYKATVIGYGTGDLAGYIKVHYEGYSAASDQYLKESSIRIPKDEVTQDFSNGPRKGRYTILSYGNIYNPITLGYFDLSNGRYNYYDAGKRLIGTGIYLYNSTDKLLVWKTGPLKDYGPSAGFEIDREGKTHKIRLKYSTIGTNSID